MKTHEETQKQAEDTDRLVLDSYEDGQKAAIKLLESARREVLFFSYDLQPRMVNNKAASDALLGILRKSQKAIIKILITDNSAIKRDGHRWLEIARRFTSNIAIRQPSPEDSRGVHTYLLVDDKALLYKPHADDYEGFLSMHAAEEVKQYKKAFTEIWDSAIPDPEVGRLHL